MGVEQTAGLVAHQAGRFHVDMGARDGELHALVLADRAAEHHAFLGVGRHLVHEPIAVADAFGGDQGAFGVQAVEDVLEALALFADQVFLGDFQIVEEEFVGLVVDHVGNGADRHAVLDGVVQVDQEDRHAFRLARDLVQRGGAGQQDHQVRVLHPRNPDLLAVDDVTVAALDRGGLDLGGVGAGGGFGHAHGLQAQFAGGDARQVLALLGFGAVAQQRAHVVHLAVAGAGIAAAAVDLFHDDRGFGQAQARAAIFLGNQRRQPARFRQGSDEVFGIAAFFVDLAEVFGGKLGAKVAHGFADVLIGVGGVGHRAAVLNVGMVRYSIECAARPRACQFTIR
ncbi:hypothetical protein D3C71_214190 [compost metagenome]